MSSMYSISSSDFHSVLTTCLDCGFTRLLDKVSEYYKPSEVECGALSLVKYVHIALKVFSLEMSQFYVQEKQRNRK